ncbi:MarR family winged helix-turn-helix transcriptional regulator [Blastococcus sp. URHD0036]|uniref:MarR family winged helix-turn-helix transcriptional regulator n=1 Tax=Blastococcus sp. URHD0036 TaxID=1380356 RepID=UPI000496A234|nr:MarR family winged helix-turn-helix transcriptional regulator [Blastococcus sp. URHD0036]
MTGPEPPGPGQTLFRFVRHWSRRWTATGEAAGSVRGRDVMAVEAVSTRAPAAASVRDVAEHLGLDHSGASRLVAEAVGRGLLADTAARGDRRQRRVVVTAAGEHLVEAAHRWQEEVFGRLTQDWHPEEVRHFHRLMARLIDGGS